MSSLDGLLVLPDYWLVDAAFFVSGAQLPLMLSEIVVFGDTATLTISDVNFVPVGTAVAVKGDYKPIKVVDSLGQWRGTLVVGKEANFPLFAAGDGTYKFGIGDAELVASTTLSLPADAGLTSLTNEFGQSMITTELVFVGETGVQLEVVGAQEYLTSGEIVDIQLLRIHAMGNSQYLHQLCTADESQRPTRFIRELVFQYGTTTHRCKPIGGSAFILADTDDPDGTALQVSQSADGIQIHLPGKPI